MNFISENNVTNSNRDAPSPQRFCFKSASKHSKNSISPLSNGDGGYGKETKPRTFSNSLFTAQCAKATKSFYIDVTKSRKIHVCHFAQNERDLHNENGSMNENFYTAIVLFFIHGVGGSADMWDPQTRYFLHEGYEVVTFDMLGHGLSSKPTDYKSYQFEQLAQDVLAVFDQFAKKRNVVIGHSYGSSFCTLLAKERGHLISKIVLISGGGPTTLMPERCSAFCLPYPLFYLISPGVVKAFRKMAFHVNTNENIKNKLTTFRLSPFALKAVMQGQHWLDSDEEFHSDLVVPVLLLHGRGDQFVTLDEEIWMNETIYGSQLEVIENAGHMVTIEAPQEVNAAIHRFLNRDKSTSSVKENCDNSALCVKDNDKSTPKEQDDDFSAVVEQRSSVSRSMQSIRSCMSERMAIDAERCVSSVCAQRSNSRISTRSVRSGRRKTMY